MMVLMFLKGVQGVQEFKEFRQMSCCPLNLHSVTPLLFIIPLLYAVSGLLASSMELYNSKY